MSQTFLEYLQGQKVDGAMIQQATRYFLAEKFPGITPPKMRRVIADSGPTADSLDAIQHQLEQDPGALDNACLITLSTSWDDPQDQQLVRNAVEEAKTKLPVIEIAILATVAMYGMYLAVTKGIKKKIVQRKADGSLTESIEYAAPQLSMIASLLRGTKGN
jgi:hypothetical protein